ncbi:MAG TPA: ATP-binding protein [Thermoanaerobaculia bacterium]|jgi:signal transduction histidine kinase/CheY-like chemotaxis protein
MTTEIAIDPEEIEARRRARTWRLAAWELPLVRTIGSIFLALAVWVHNHFLLVHPPDQGFLLTTIVVAAWAVVSWLAIVAALRRDPPIDLTLPAFAIDVLVWTFAIYQSGAEASWLFFIPLLRVADQVQTTFRRALGFALFGAACYGGMLLYVSAYVRPVAAAPALAKLIFLLFAGSYIALSARTAESRRRELTNAVRMSRELIRKLEEAHARAEEASAAKSEFVANMSHEMRTPLQGVIGMLQLAIDDEPAETTVRRLETARRSADTLLGMIDDVLDFSRIEARKLDLEPVYFPLRQLMTDTMKSIAALAASKKLTLSYYVHPDCPETVWGDPVRLRQILFNLIGNAIKFTHEGEIAVHVSRAKGKIRFDVRDTGVGIAPAVHQRIFEPFTQEDSSLSRRYGGAGLGLSIVVRLLDAMGGTVELASEQGEGSVFSFTIPLPADAVGAAPQREPWESTLAGKSVLIIEPALMSRAAIAEILRSRGVFASAFARAADAPLHGRFVCAITADPNVDVHPQVVIKSPLEGSFHPIQITRPVGERELLDAIATAIGQPGRVSSYTLPPPVRSGSALRVLVVDDNEVNREVVAEMLKRLGHEVMTAPDGEQALATLGARHFDAVFMDVQLPGIDGLEVTRQFRATTRGTPVIGLTAHTSREDRDRCLAAGMASVLVKPVVAQQLEQALESVVARDALEEITGGNPILLERVRDAFARQTPELLEGIRDGLARGDAETVARHAHKLKGSLSYFQGRALLLARELESAAKGGELAKAAGLLPDLEIALSAVSDVLGVRR